MTDVTFSSMGSDARLLFARADPERLGRSSSRSSGA